MNKNKPKGLLLSGNLEVGNSFRVLGTDISGKGAALILFELSPGDFLDCDCGQVTVDIFK